MFKSYSSHARGLAPEILASPSVNAIIHIDGTAKTRLGYETHDTLAGIPLSTYYQQQYDIAFIQANGLIYVRNYKTSTTYSLGVAVSSTDALSWAEYGSDVYCTSKTDGLKHFIVAQLNGAVSIAGSIIIDQDGAGRLLAFSLTTGTININGTSETYSAVAVGGTLTSSASQAYADNSVMVRYQDLSSTVDKAGLITFWKERMVLADLISVGNLDQGQSSILFGGFAASDNLEYIINFSSATGYAPELVGKTGKITAIFATEDYLYAFKANETYVASISDVNTVTGSTLFNLRSPIHGCNGSNSVADMGNGEIVVVTSSRRIIRFKIATDSGAPVVFPDESFDVAIKELVDKLDNGASSLCFYNKGARQCICEVQIDGRRIRFIYDNNIRAWQPPQVGNTMGTYYERNGVLFGGSRGNATLYQIDSTNNDNGSPIECYIASPIFENRDGQFDVAEIFGKITQPTDIYSYVSLDDTLGDISSLSGSDYSYPLTQSIGTVSLGSTTLGSSSITSSEANFEWRYDQGDGNGRSWQLILFSLGDSHAFTVKGYTLNGRIFSELAIDIK